MSLPPADATRRRVLVAEPSIPISGALKRFLEGAHFEVKVVHYLDEAVQRVQEGGIDVVFTSASRTFGGESLCSIVKRRAPSLPVVLMYPPEEEDPSESAAAAGADGYLVGPIKRGTVVSTTKAMLRIRDLLQTVERLEGDLKKHVAEPPADLTEQKGSSADFEFFKKFLLMEVKRSRRYKYPVSFLVVAIDHLAERLVGKPQHRRVEVLTEALENITRGIRDIDLAVPFSGDRFLVFLPHTPREGALVVATRLQARVAKGNSLENLTASVGVASYEPDGAKGPVSFGSLMKEASDALRRAQLAGGNRVEASGERKSKRERISIG